MSYIRVVAVASLALAGAALMAPAAAAQSLWNGRDEGRVIAFEWAKPNFKGSVIGDVSSAIYSSIRWPVSPSLILAAEVPLAYGDIESESRLVLGNPYLGVDAGVAGSPFRVELGARVPLASDSDASWTGNFVGFFADVPDRMEAFVPKMWVFQGIANYVREYETGVGLRLRAGPVLVHDADAFEGDDSTELLLGYGAHSHYTTGAVRLDGGISGRYLVTEDEGNFNDRSLHQIGVGASYAAGRIRPGLYVRVPLDKDVRNDVFGTVVGVGVSYRL